MCRLAAFPPGFPRDMAEEILRDYGDSHKDGTGSCYVKGGDFVLNKWPMPYKDVLSRKLPLLSHMPYPGWTILHVRLATHGKNKTRNTHPFVKGDWAFAHNGVWSGYDAVRAALFKSYRFRGETDSEVAGALFDHVGPKRFFSSMNSGSNGVFLALNKDGTLWLVKTSGSVQYVDSKMGPVISSQFPYGGSFKEQKKKNLESGYMHLGADGKKVIERKMGEYFYDSSRYSSCATPPYGLRGACSSDDDRELFPYGCPEEYEAVTEQLNKDKERSRLWRPDDYNKDKMSYEDYMERVACGD